MLPLTWPPQQSAHPGKSDDVDISSVSKIVLKSTQSYRYAQHGAKMGTAAVAQQPAYTEPGGLLAESSLKHL